MIYIWRSEFELISNRNMKHKFDDKIDIAIDRLFQFLILDNQVHTKIVIKDPMYESEKWLDSKKRKIFLSWWRHNSDDSFSFKKRFLIIKFALMNIF